MDTPSIHTRYRAQRLIRMGEWLEENSDILIALIDGVDDAHTDSLDDTHGDVEERLQVLQMRQMAPLKALLRISGVLRRGEWPAELGKDVTLHHPAACPVHRYEVLIKAPESRPEPSGDAG